MKVPMHWLRTFVPIEQSPEQLAHLLTMSGIEIESIESIGSQWGDTVVTGRIMDMEHVKDSDHLRFAHVDVGTDVLEIVCGAPNIQVGDIVPVARTGAVIQGTTIQKTRKMQYDSEGMLCSAYELGLGNDHTGIYILDTSVATGLSLCTVLGDVVLNASILPHRGDLLSIYGFAREVAALTGHVCALPEGTFAEQGEPVSAMVTVNVRDPELCSYYSARVVSALEIHPSPEWMRRRLLLSGMRPINNVVDITNYVMLELGQPLHAFDYGKLAHRHMVVRRGRSGECLSTLDGTIRDVSPDTLLICDEDYPVAIAGVMGGETSEVEEHTTAVLIEAAIFHPGNIRRTATSLKLRTDASAHFEKGIDSALPRVASSRAMHLFAELAHGQVHPGIVEYSGQQKECSSIPFHAQDMEWLTGMPVPLSECEKALNALDFQVHVLEEERYLQVTPPSYRMDIKEPADLVEEVLRYIGYEYIPSRIPAGTLPGIETDTWFDREYAVRQTLNGLGYSEIVLYSMTSRERTLKLLPYADSTSVPAFLTDIIVSEDDFQADNALPTPSTLRMVALTNPPSREWESMRITLLAGLLETVAKNSRHTRNSLQFFEIGRRFIPTKNVNEQPFERHTLGIALSGISTPFHDTGSVRETDFFTLKGCIESLLSSMHIRARYTRIQHPSFHPGKCAMIEVLNKREGREAFAPVGVFGEAHPLVQESYVIPERVYLCELDLDLLYKYREERVTSFQPFSEYPFILRDITIVVDTTLLHEEVQAAIISERPSHVQSIQLKDVYTGESIAHGKKSMTYTLTYQHMQRTLSDEEVNIVHFALMHALNARFGNGSIML